MKRKMVLGLMLLAGLLLICGCSLKSLKVGFMNKKNEPVKTVEDQQPVVAGKTTGQVAHEVNNMIDEMVEKINAGDWGQAITIGEAAYTITENVKLANTKNSPDANLDSLNEKLFETLVEAYDYKNFISGLNPAEIIRYVTVAQAHYRLNPSEPFKKLALAKVLIDTNNITEGLKLATEIYNSKERNKDVTDNYAWALYKSGKKVEAYNIYKIFFLQSETLIQLYHSAVVIEEYDKTLGLVLYKGCEKAGNNLLVLEPNVHNLSAESYINFIKSSSRKSVNRLLVGGFRIDSQYNVNTVQSVVNSISNLAKSN